MTPIEYQNDAARTFTAPVLRGLVPPLSNILQGAFGLCGEAGEVAELVKKTVFQGHDLDRGVLLEELGDVLWYLTLTAMSIGYDLQTVMETNVEKRRRRYPDGFDPARSMERRTP